jgi:GTP-binding protein
LGHQFLRHTERTRLLVHVLDVGGLQGREPVEDFNVVNRELALYNASLTQKPLLIAANKMDLPGAGENLTHLEQTLAGAYEIIPVSALTGEGLKTLIKRISQLLLQIPVPRPEPDLSCRATTVREEIPFTVTRREGIFIVEGRAVEKLVAMTDFNNRQALDRLQKKINRPHPRRRPGKNYPPALHDWVKSPRCRLSCGIAMQIAM